MTSARRRGVSAVGVLVAAAAAVWFFGPAPEGGDGETNGVDVAVHRRPAPPLSTLPARAPERREEREASALPEPVPVEPDLRIDVVDPDDLPLPGAVVTLLRANEHGDLELSETVARTDSSGRARFEAEVLRSFAELHVLVDHPDFALHVGPLYWEGEPDEVASVRLHPAATFRGQVVENGTGTPVAGARLVIVEFGVYEDLAPGFPVEVVTDQEGRFEKTRVPDDDLGVTVLRRGFTSFTLS